MCSVEAAMELQCAHNAVVKVSFVEDAGAGSGEGEGKRASSLSCDVMFRSKQVVFETPACASAQPEWHAGFEYGVYAPPGRDWGALRGDMLFTLYDCQAQRNIFVGQVLVPLRSLLDLDGPRVRGGSQAERSGVHPLVDRSGANAGAGRLSLRLRLELPADEPGTPPRAGGSPRAGFSRAGSSRAPPPPHAQVRSGSARTGGTQSEAAAAARLAAVRARRKERDRMHKQKKIDKENRDLHRRLEAARGLLAARKSGSGPGSYAKETRLWRKGSAKQLQAQRERESNELRALSGERDALVLRIAQTKDDNAKLRTATQRDHALLRRKDLLQSRLVHAKEVSDSRSAISGFRSRGRSWSREGEGKEKVGDRGRTTTRAGKELERSRLQARKALEAYETERAKVKAVVDQEVALKAEREQTQRRLKEVEDELRLVAMRETVQVRRSSSATHLWGVEHVADSEVLEDENEKGQDNVLDMQAAMRRVRVDIAVAKAALESEQARNDKEICYVEEDVAALVAKLARKQVKAAAERARSEELRAQAHNGDDAEQRAFTRRKAAFLAAKASALRA